MPVEKQKILIVDDTPENIQILNEALRSDYEICFALNGEDAIQNALAVKPDLILLDIMMPEMDGYEVCIALKENPALKDIPVIFITALEQADYETRGLELGAVDYVTKPFNPAIVRLRVHNHLELKRQRDALAARNEDLREALSKIKTLSGLLPICSSCKKIRDDKGYWSQIEGYISDHSAAEFSHSICPDCAKKLYPDLCDEIYPENKPSHGLRILLAEDDEINRTIALAQIQNLGHAADAVADGREVLEALQRAAYDVIFMDCQMAEMDGYEAARMIRLREKESKQKPVYIVAMTAHASQADRDESLAAGMNDHLTKPVTEADLKAILDRCAGGEDNDNRARVNPLPAPDSKAAIGTDRTSSRKEDSDITPEEAPVDMERLREISEGNAGRSQELIGLYLLQADGWMGELEAAIKVGATKEVNHLAHKLAGSSVSCGMRAIVGPLRELEQRSRQGRLSDAGRLFSEVQGRLESIRSYLAEQRSCPRIRMKESDW